MQSSEGLRQRDRYWNQEFRRLHPDADAYDSDDHVIKTMQRILATDTDIKTQISGDLPLFLRKLCELFVHEAVDS